MTTKRTYLKRMLMTAAASLACLLTSAVAVDAARQPATSRGCSGSYGWPVKPFDRPHQIRGAFGDPRTKFDGPPTRDTLLGGDGSFSFHQGIDITAPDGTAVYSVGSGTVTRVTQEWVGVDCGNGRSFEYWHITSRVHVGQKVVAHKTVLGLIKRSEAHVHLTVREDGRVMNAIGPGGLSPYEDTTTPEITGIALRSDERGADEMPQYIHGRVHLLVEAIDYAEPIDTPGLRTPNVYRGWIVTPARITWRIERWNGRVVQRERVARDVRRSVPVNSRFWETFARGTCQNQSVFGSHYSYLQPGRYLFRLTPRPFDTRTLRDGVYDLVVTAVDIAGHRDSARLRFTVSNDSGV
jgi:murein DD-endopeptidase MepM/ murein hydrolase activator NlpD